MMIVTMIMKSNLQMPIWWQQVNTGCGEMNDDNDDNNKTESPDVDMLAASEHSVWRDE